MSRLLNLFYWPIASYSLVRHLLLLYLTIILYKFCFLLTSHKIGTCLPFTYLLSTSTIDSITINTITIVACYYY